MRGSGQKASFLRHTLRDSPRQIGTPRPWQPFHSTITNRYPHSHECRVRCHHNGKPPPRWASGVFERNVFLIFLRHVFSPSDNLGFVSDPPPGLVFIHSFFLEEGMRDLIFKVFHGARHGDQSRVRMPDTAPPGSSATRCGVDWRRPPPRSTIHYDHSKRDEGECLISRVPRIAFWGGCLGMIHVVSRLVSVWDTPYRPRRMNYKSYITCYVGGRWSVPYDIDGRRWRIVSFSHLRAPEETASKLALGHTKDGEARKPKLPSTNLGFRWWVGEENSAEHSIHAPRA